MTKSDYITTGDIARLLDWPLHRVTNGLQRLGISEDARAGTYRLYRRDRLPQIVAAIATPHKSEQEIQRRDFTRIVTDQDKGGDQ